MGRRSVLVVFVLLVVVTAAGGVHVDGGVILVALVSGDVLAGQIVGHGRSPGDAGLRANVTLLAGWNAVTGRGADGVVLVRRGSAAPAVILADQSFHL